MALPALAYALRAASTISARIGRVPLRYATL